MADTDTTDVSLDFREIGDTGLKRSYGWLYEEFLLQLQGRKAAQVYREMGDNDSTVGAVLYALENIVRQVTWTTCGTNKAFLDDLIGDMSHTWEDFVAEALSKLQFGYSFHEIVYKMRPDGRVGWKKLPIRAQETCVHWEFDDNGGIEGMVQSAMAQGYRYTTIPIEKALLFRTSYRKNNPEGRSVLRTAYRSWWFKKRIEEIEAIGVERDLAGIPKIGVPPELLAADQGSDAAASLAAFKDIGVNLRNDEQACVIYPLVYDESGNKMYEIELMSGSGRRQFVTGEIIARRSTEIAQASLADVILLGHESVGSFALSETKEALLAVGLQAQVDEIAAVFNKYAIPRLWALNGMDPTKCPKVVPGELHATNLKDLAQVIWQLSMAGMPFFPSESMEDWVRARMDAPAADGTEMVQNPNTGQRGMPGEKLPPGSKMPHESDGPEPKEPAAEEPDTDGA